MNITDEDIRNLIRLDPDRVKNMQTEGLNNISLRIFIQIIKLLYNEKFSPVENIKRDITDDDLRKLILLEPDRVMKLQAEG